MPDFKYQGTNRAGSSVSGVMTAGSKAELPLIESAHFRVGARETLLRKWHVALPQIYMEAAHIEELYYP